MKKIFLVLLLFFSMTVSAQAVDGTVNVASSFSVQATADRLEIIMQKKGLTVFNRIKHSEGAKLAGIDLRKTELLIFGNPVVGAPLMKCQQTVAIDLPQKMLVWEDKDGKVWITYNSPQYLRDRHTISGCDKIIAKLEKVLASISLSASTE
ncbi:DUF302 domain-containing protein [Desulfogranum marinum]|uniref:DUF302 domain-containing protein n=1 Tax=Desulfogranum marinum TaxID=453220 RepID=UPI0029C8DEC8|nr:DUF302 domain-containing protein [Desulfogranum marinum]